MNQSSKFVAKLNEYVQSMPELATAPREAPAATPRILVALDASPQSLAALEAATALAKLLRAEIYGVFVEDTDLERLCSLPFSAEVGAYSATARALSHYCITREFQALEDAIRLTLQRVATAAGVPWSLQIVRGGVTTELLNAASNAMVVSLGRIGWSLGGQMGSTAMTMIRQAKRPLLLPGKLAMLANARQSSTNLASLSEIKLVYTGTDAADRALVLAHELSITSGRQLVVYYISDPLTDSTKRNHALAQAQVISLRQRGTSHILNVLHSSLPGITVLADADAHLTISLMDNIDEPLLIV